MQGVDAFERGQIGWEMGAPNQMPIGDDAAKAMAGQLRPDTKITFAQGEQTYGRPVATMSNSDGDVGEQLIRQGLAVVEPQYLKDDPERLKRYLAAQEDAKANKRGAHAGTFESPAAFRHWKKTGKWPNDVGIVIDPALAGPDGVIVNKAPATNRPRASASPPTAPKPQPSAGMTQERQDFIADQIGGNKTQLDEYGQMNRDDALRELYGPDFGLNEEISYLKYVNRMSKAKGKGLTLEQFSRAQAEYGMVHVAPAETARVFRGIKNGDRFVAPSNISEYMKRKTAFSCQTITRK